ncbi:MAG: bifunctional phosphoribosylaminoimidazolecarboxamide formyltransferase/IMP cyclohydrolase, partial [Gemmatimonadaceae bacterium]
MPLALISVSNKTGLVDFTRQLAVLGWDIVSTGGTARALRDEGLKVTEVSDLTGFPEIMDGRVKTLHPAVHGGLLARRDNDEHMAVAAEHGIAPIDLVAVNLYPFQATASRRGATAEEVIENIDIGGPSMLRSAAKNFQSVTVVVDPADYQRVIATLEAEDDDLDLRRRLAEKVFAHTAAYDSAIAYWFACARDEEFPDRALLSMERALTLRYGENPGQQAAFYIENPGRGLGALVQKGGKDLSFNNFLDLEGALLATDQFIDETCCAIVKHTTPSGLATGSSAVEAYRKALACDPLSAFGSVISFTVAVDEETAEAVS